MTGKNKIIKEVVSCAIILTTFILVLVYLYQVVL